MQIRHLCLAPLCDGERAHVLGGQGKVRRNAKQHIGGKGVDSRFNQAHIPIGRFNENLRLGMLEHPLLQKFELFLQLRLFGRQVAVEAKVLPVHAGSHQPQQNRRRPNEGHYLNTPLMCRLYDNSAGVSDARAAGFGEETYVFALFGISQEALPVLRGRMLGNFVKGQLTEGLNGVGRLDKAAGGLGALGNEDIQPVQDINDVLRQCVFCAFSERGGDEIEFSFVRHGNAKVVTFVEIQK